MIKAFFTFKPDVTAARIMSRRLAWLPTFWTHKKRVTKGKVYREKGDILLKSAVSAVLLRKNADLLLFQCNDINFYDDVLLSQNFR